MNGEPLRPDHGAPFRLVVPHWFAVASVKWLHRIDVLTEPYVGEFQTGHYIYEWPDRPHEPVTADARAGPHHRPGTRQPCSPSARTPIRGKAWSGTGPITSVEVSFTGEGEWHPAELDRAHRALPVAGLDLRLATPPTSAGTPSGPERPTPPATSSQRSHRGTGSATATTPSRSSYVDVR